MRLVDFNLRLYVLYEVLRRLERWDVVSGNLDGLFRQNVTAGLGRTRLDDETTETAQVHVFASFQTIAYRAHERLDRRLNVMFLHTGLLCNPVYDIRFGHLTC